MKKILKRIASLLLVFTFCFTSMAAVVSDNDGSAFITKAEFDSLKNDFQAQINNYNTSIDAKIDGAIAAYLAGLDMNSWAAQSFIGYRGDNGTLSVAGRSDMSWKNGRMYGTLIVLTSRQRDTAVANIGTMRLEGRAPKSVAESNPFWELCIGNVEYDKAMAEWKGYSKCLNSFYFISARVSPVTTSSYMTWSNTVVSAWYLHRGNGLTANSNVDLGVKAAGDDENRVLHMGMTTSRTGGSWTNAFVINRGGAFLNREIKETKYKHIILTPSSKSENRFSNVDEIRDWCNDTIDGTTNKLSDHGQGEKDGFIGSLCDNYECKIVRFNSASSTAATEYEPTVVPQSDAGSSLSFVNMYLGFAQPINNYNKLWTSDYDSYIEDMIDHDSSMSYATHTNYSTNEKTKHLWINSGLPISKIVKNNNVRIKMNFKHEDTNGDGKIDDKDEIYRVWFKWGAFKYNADPSADTVIEKDVKLSNGKAVTYNSNGKYWTIKNGETVIVPKNDKDMYLFMKWSPNNTSNGGGTFIGEPQIQVQQAD